MKKTKKDKRLNKTDECLNCHQHIGNKNFCSNCGQQNVNKQASLRDFIHDALGDLFTFDHKFFRSFKPLLLKPGFLTNEYNNGRRVNFILPLRLYFFVSLIFFFVYTMQGVEESSFIQQSSTRTLPSDTIIDYLSQYESLDELKTLQLNRKLSKKFFKIQLNRDGRIWDNFFRNEYSVNDSTRNVMAYLLFSRFNIDLEEEPESSKMATQNFINKLQDPLFSFSEDSAKQLFKLISKNYELNQTFYHPTTNTWKYFKKEIREMIPDTNYADYLRREILINFTFLSEGNQIKTDLTDMDSTSWLYSFGKRLEAQGKKIDNNENANIELYRIFFNQLPTVIFCLLPIFALILKVFYFKRKIFYVNHLIFALHAHTIVFIYLLFGILIDLNWVYVLLVPGIWIHLFLSLKNVYGQSKFMSFIKLNSIFFFYLFFVLIGLILTLGISLLKY